MTVTSITTATLAYSEVHGGLETRAIKQLTIYRYNIAIYDTYL